MIWPNTGLRKLITETPTPLSVAARASAELVESMFEKDQVLVDDVRKMRDTADEFNVDLKEELQVPTAKLERFFTVELEDLLDSGSAIC